MKLEIQPGIRRTRAFVSGLIDESADFAPLQGVEGDVEIDLHGVSRFNSAGVRAWVDAMRDLGGRARLVFVDCSPPVIDQLNMIEGFLGHGEVASFQAPMECPRCDQHTLHRFETRECHELGGLPAVACASCGGDLSLADSEDHYLLFIREPTQVK